MRTIFPAKAVCRWNHPQTAFYCCNTPSSCSGRGRATVFFASLRSCLELPVLYENLMPNAYLAGSLPQKSNLCQWRRIKFFREEGTWRRLPPIDLLIQLSYQVVTLCFKRSPAPALSCGVSQSCAHTGRMHWGAHRSIPKIATHLSLFQRLCQGLALVFPFSVLAG